MRHGRIPWPTADELDEEQRAVHHAITAGPRASSAPAFSLTDDEGRLHGPFNAMLLAPRVGLALQELGGALRYRTSLTDREREIADPAGRRGATLRVRVVRPRAGRRPRRPHR